MRAIAPFHDQLTMLHLTRSCLSAAGLALTLALSATPAGAGTVEARFGALDGLGIGLAQGGAFVFDDLVNPQADGTNDWAFGGFTAQVGTAWSGTLTGASLQVFAGGWGTDGGAAVYLNNQLVGQLTNGDGDANGVDYNTAWLDSFDLSAYLSLIGTDNIVEIRANVDDGGSLGYVKLVLQTQDAGGGNAVPEPASAALALAAIGSALLASRRRRQA